MAEEIVEIVAEYKTSLEDLTFNSKPAINMLTMVAEENIEHASEIARVIEERIHKAPSGHRLPTLYLIDSIIKNIHDGTRRYLQLFSNNLVSIFAAVFEKVDEKSRQAMYKLRQTWTPLFPNKKLYALDTRISQIDPAWPVTAKSPETSFGIHVNPKFLTTQPPSPDHKEQMLLNQKLLAEQEHLKQEKEAAQTREKIQEEQKLIVEEKRKREKEEALMREQLLAKQQELLRLQQERLELELMEARTKLENETKQLQVKEQQMRQQLLMQLQKNEAQSKKSETVAEEKETPGASRDPRRKRDPRLAARDPRTQVVSTNSTNTPASSRESSPVVVKPPTTTPPESEKVQNNNKSEKLDSNKEEKQQSSKSSSDSKGKEASTKSPSRDRNNRKEESPRASRRTSDQKVVKKTPEKSDGESGSESKSSDIEKPKRNYRVSRSPSQEKEDNRSPSKNFWSRPPRTRHRPRSRSPSPDKRSRSPSRRERGHRGPTRGRTTGRETRSSREKNYSSRPSDEHRPRDKESPNKRSTASRKNKKPDKIDQEEKESLPPAKKAKTETTKETETQKENKTKNAKSEKVKEEKMEEDKVETQTEKTEEKEKSKPGALTGDLAELFGTEDIDYRRLPPIPKLAMNGPHASNIEHSTVLASPSSARWSQFKENHPDEFPFTQPRPSVAVQKQVSREMFSSPLQERPTDDHGFTLRKPGEKSSLSLDQSSDILKKAEDQLRTGKLTTAQHRDLLEQLKKLQELQKLKQQIRQQKMMINDAKITPKTLEDLNKDNFLGQSDDLEPLAPFNPVPFQDSMQKADEFPETDPAMFEPDESSNQGYPKRFPLLKTPPSLLDIDTDSSEPMPGPRDGFRQPRPRGPPGHYQPRGPRGGFPGPQMRPDIRGGPGPRFRTGPRPGPREPFHHRPRGRGGFPGDPRESGPRSRPDPRQPRRPLLPTPANNQEESEFVEDKTPEQEQKRRVSPGPPPEQQQQQQQQNQQPQQPQQQQNQQQQQHGHHRSLDHMETFEPLAVPWYDTEAYYCPHHDPRWVQRARAPNIRERDGLFLTTETLKISLPRGDKERPIYLGSCMFRIKFVREERMLYVDDEPFYRIGDAPKTLMKGKRPHKISVVGIPKDIWIDEQHYQLRLDAPPEVLTFSDREHKFQIDGVRNVVVVDGHDICPADGPPKKIQLAYIVHEIRFDPPPRHILIDGSLCELDLIARYPVLIMNNKPRGIRFDGPPRDIVINNQVCTVPMDIPRRARLLGPKPMLLAFGGPGHEIIIEDNWYEVKFGAPPKEIQIGTRRCTIELKGAPPEVKILGEYIPVDQIHLRVGYPPGTAHSVAPPNPGDQPAGSMPEPFQQPQPFGSDVKPVGGFNMGQNMPGPEGQIPVNQESQNNPGFIAPGINQGPAIPPKVDVHDLLSRLVQSGVINTQNTQKTTKEASPARETPPPATGDSDFEGMVSRESVEDIPDLTRIIAAQLKKQYKGAVQLLSVGIQCASCGLRFVPEQKEQYKEHLDWHFRQNKRGKDEMKVAKHRHWYYAVTDWIQYEEVADLEQKAQSAFFESTPHSTDSQLTRGLPGQGDVVSCPAVSGKEGDDTCGICGETFEQFWDEDEEEWHLRDAIRASGKTYHPLCYEDVGQSNTSLVETPSPNIYKLDTAPLLDPTIADSVDQPADQNTDPAQQTPAPQQEPELKPVLTLLPVQPPLLMEMINNPLQYLTSLSQQMKRASSASSLPAMAGSPASTEAVAGGKSPAQVTGAEPTVPGPSPAYSQVTTAEPTVPGPSPAYTQVTAAESNVPGPSPAYSQVTAAESNVPGPSPAYTQVTAAESNVPGPRSPATQASTEPAPGSYSPAQIRADTAPGSNSPAQIKSDPFPGSQSPAQVDNPIAITVVAPTNVQTVIPTNIASHYSSTPVASTTPAYTPPLPVIPSGSSTPLHDEGLSDGDGGRTPVRDEPGVESGRGTPVEDEPMEPVDARVLYPAGASLLHVITPLGGGHLPDAVVKLEPSDEHYSQS